MKKIAVFLCVVTIMFSLCGCEENYTHGVYQVTITATEVYNDSVGSDWQKVYSCNGRVINSGECWTVPLDTAEIVTIVATITERENYPDTACGSLSVRLEDGFKTNTNIIVKEDRGRYAGNTAQWDIACSVKLVNKVAF